MAPLFRTFRVGRKALLAELLHAVAGARGPSPLPAHGAAPSSPRLRSSYSPALGPDLPLGCRTHPTPEAWLHFQLHTLLDLEISTKPGCALKSVLRG